ncbi:MAG: hypothetical protein KDB26_16760, partial [Microthrixaceae bacterium]|nr:hypothetical protein [Microthrixaceae bacterium]
SAEGPVTPIARSDGTHARNIVHEFAPDDPSPVACAAAFRPLRRPPERRCRVRSTPTEECP